mmetsp:Transcript_15475/g.31803  ORF Transcript_15475/g.31803 Transcript_15475/m.31803 type:complete len:436 (-) Transcript_15475:233-1540(-)
MLRACRALALFTLMISAASQPKLRSATSSRKRRGQQGRNKAGGEAVSKHPNSAAYWSQLHLKPESELDALPKEVGSRVAVVITGVLRVSSEYHLERIIGALRGSDTFVVTYEACRALASRISKDILVVDPNSAPTAKGTAIDNSMYQWLLLERALSHWQHLLLKNGKYHTIAKFRVDLHFPDDFLFRHLISRRTNETGIVFAQSDVFFYAQPRIFVSIFSGMFVDSMSTYSARILTQSERASFDATVDEHGGLEPSCLAPLVYSPRQSRQSEFVPAAHPRTKFKRLKTPREIRGNAVKAAKASGRYVEARRQRHLLAEKEEPSDELYTASVKFCGCKFGLGHPMQGSDRLRGPRVGWLRSGSPRPYQSEPAMGYHILMHQASCLPLDLPHRESFFLYPGRKTSNFTYGLDSSEGLLDEQTNGDVESIDDDKQFTS